MFDRENLAVIIPVSEDEERWRYLLKDLRVLPQNTEIILTGPKNIQSELEEIVSQEKLKATVIWVNSPKGRARQMNMAAKNTNKEILWFLHADSRVDAHAFKAIKKMGEKAKSLLFYFNLKFQDDGPRLTFLNFIGVWVRSHFMKMPFGDQGFLIGKCLFECVGGYPEDVVYGEDHLFVWKARQKGIALKCTGTFISTSARKYARDGWLKTTVHHGRLAYKQALPELFRMLFKKRAKNNSPTSGAIAVFVKTPGLSPVKTRLAKDIGDDLAQEFYLKSKCCTEWTVSKACQMDVSVQPYWAVAESSGASASFWKNWQVIFQGNGGLGKRLSSVYTDLLDKHQYAILTGADSPQLKHSVFLRVAMTLSQAAKSNTPLFVIGRADDGGFYLFGGTKRIPEYEWETVPYSCKETADSLIKNLRSHGDVIEVPKELDVDTVDDLIKLKNQFKERTDLNDIQQDLLEWIMHNLPNISMLSQKQGKLDEDYFETIFPSNY